MKTNKLYTHVKGCWINAEAAISAALNLNHPSKWDSDSLGGVDELRLRRKFRNREGKFEAGQRRGYWLVTFEA